MMNHLPEPSPTQPASHDEAQRREQVLLRTLPILLIPIGVAIVFGFLFALFNANRLGAVPPPEDRGNVLIPIVVVAIFFTALIMLVRLGRANLSAYLLVGAWTLITTLLGVQMGVNSLWPALLIVPICAAGLLLDGAASISLAGLATVLVLVLAWLEMNGFSFAMRVPPVPSTIAENAPAFASSFWIGVFWTVAALTFLLARGLQRALVSSRKQAAALSELSTQLEQRVQEQTAELLQQEREAAMLEERTRVAREIHDTIAQGLTGIIVQLGAAQRATANESPDAPRHLELAQQLARESLAEARRSIWNLRSPILERGDLTDALASLAVRPLGANIEVHFEQRGTEWILRAEVESSLLRVAQEALVNAAKHAQATQVEVVLEYASDQVQLSINDNGIGLDEETLRAQNVETGPWGGFGLLGMRERVRALGATLTLTNEGGTQVCVSIARARAEAVTESPTNFERREESI
jgi:signal transduction histidine kinase